ncbi:hypothetical protein SAMN05428977_10893 [Nitrosomonas sp. Nm166]|nr:hypothetical protein SAMN05428977_10893 [Nitrosomonas sp. Nm166]
MKDRREQEGTKLFKAMIMVIAALIALLALLDWLRGY